MRTLSTHPQERARRFWSSVDKNGPIPKHDTSLGKCWVWTRGKVNGYGRFHMGKEFGGQGSCHRFSYEYLIGKIPEGLDLDHLCRNRACVNPSHLEPVTPRVNILRGTAPSFVNRLNGVCSKGHLLTKENSYFIREKGKLVRRCRNCSLASSHRHLEKNPYQKVANKKSRGETHRSAKLKEDDVLEIRRLYAGGNLSQLQLSKMFGIAKGGISLMVNRKTWKHI